MPSQYFTIVKIGGEAADAAWERFRRWHGARVTDRDSPEGSLLAAKPLFPDTDCSDGDEWQPEQWPDQVRKEVDQFADNLRDNAHQPPILFFAEFVDLWSMHPAATLRLDLVMGNRYDIMCIKLPLSEKRAGDLKKSRRYGQWDEDRFFAATVLAAATAWGKLVEKSILIVLRRAVGGLVTDEEIMDSLNTTPDWLHPS